MMNSQTSLTDYEKRAEQRARHRDLIMQILRAKRWGLTTQQIMDVEREWYGYTFLTDNRLRELRDKYHLAYSRKDEKDGLLRWFPTMQREEIGFSTPK